MRQVKSTHRLALPHPGKKAAFSVVCHEVPVNIKCGHPWGTSRSQEQGGQEGRLSQHL